MVRCNRGVRPCVSPGVHGGYAANVAALPGGFNGGGGRDVVMDFSRAEGDQIRISPTDAANFEALSAHVVEDGGNTIIELGGQAIVLLGVAKSALTAADFVFGVPCTLYEQLKLPFGPASSVLRATSP